MHECFFNIPIEPSEQDCQKHNVEQCRNIMLIKFFQLSNIGEFAIAGVLQMKQWTVCFGESNSFIVVYEFENM